MRTPNMGMELFGVVGVGWREDATAGLLIDSNMQLIDEAFAALVETVSQNLPPIVDQGAF